MTDIYAPHPAPRQQGIIKSVQLMFASTAGAVTHLTSAASEGAEALEVLARTGKNMAIDNEEYVKQRSSFERDRKIAELVQEMQIDLNINPKEKK